MLGILASAHPLQEFEIKEITPGGPQCFLQIYYYIQKPFFFFGAKKIMLPQ
jgi:hypothetical protein